MLGFDALSSDAISSSGAKEEYSGSSLLIGTSTTTASGYKISVGAGNCAASTTVVSIGRKQLGSVGSGAINSVGAITSSGLKISTGVALIHPIGGGNIVYVDRYVADSALIFTSKAVEVEFYYVRTDPDV